MYRIKKRGGTLKVKAILSFVSDVFEFFLSFKMTLHLSKLKLIKAFNFTIKKGSKILTVFFLSFSECFQIDLRNPAALKSPF